jgi:hypothetical protein
MFAFAVISGGTHVLELCGPDPVEHYGVAYRSCDGEQEDVESIGRQRPAWQ